MPKGIYIRTKWHREITRKAMTGLFLLEKHKQNISKALKGIKKPMGFSEKLRKANLGKHHSEETKLKISLVQKGKPKIFFRGIKHYLYGKSHLETTKLKIGLANAISLKGYKQTKEHIEKKARSRIGEKSRRNINTNVL